LRYQPPSTLLLRWPMIALGVLASVWALLAVAPPQPVTSPYGEWVGPAQPVPALPDPWPQSLAVDAARVVEGRFAPGSTLVSCAGTESRAAWHRASFVLPVTP